MKIFVTPIGKEEFEIKDLYWFEENYVHIFDDKDYTFRFEEGENIIPDFIKLSKSINEILTRLTTYIYDFDRAIDKKILADLAWMKMIESIDYPKEIDNVKRIIIEQSTTAMNMASDSGENMSKEIIELWDLIQKWKEKHADS
jgi:hypothetical protein